MTTEDKIRLISAKVKNLIYYRLEVEERLWETRYRCQYIHQVRGLRSVILKTLPEINDQDPRKDWLIGIVKQISPRIKSTECLSTIVNMKKYVEQERAKKD